MPRLYLASTSPRRRELLERARIPFSLLPAELEDGLLQPGRSDPEHWVCALAYMKAAAGAQRLACRQLESDPAATHNDTVLGADTICVKDGQILGKPSTRDQARDMLAALRGGTHRVITGVALVSGAERRDRRTFCDTTQVLMGRLSDQELDDYIASDNWRGKAGGYNLTDRQDAGWPIDIVGDPTTVVGLPMRKLTKALAELGVTTQD